MDMQESSQQSNSTPLELSLYENAIDSIRHALEHYISDPDEKRRYKYAILHLSQGVILLLKERLKLEHPNFIYTHLTEESNKTVELDEALRRLEKIAKVDLTYYVGAIKELNGVRNKIEHYAVSLSKQQVDSIIGRIIPFLIFFTESELNRTLRHEIGDTNWQALLSIQEYVVHAIEDAKTKIRSENKKPYFCEKCHADTAMEVRTFPEDNNKWSLRGSEIRCLVCSDFVAIRTQCRQCGLEIMKSYNINTHSYCSDCMIKLQQEYPNSYKPEYVEEVRRWFLENETITREKLEDLLWNLVSAGPGTRSDYMNSLYGQGFIDFANEYQKAQYLALEEAMPTSRRSIFFADGLRFKWVYSKSDSQVISKPDEAL